MTSNKLTLDIIRQLPKAELHCHLDGFVRPQTVLELAAEQKVKLPTTDLEELTNLMTVSLDCPDLPTYLQCFDIVNIVMQQPYAITRIFFEACQDAAADGISYIELRFAPALHTKNGHSYSQILEAAIDGCVLAEAQLNITPRIICCAMRQMSPEINSEIAEICWRYRHRYVVGFDLAGPEFGFPPQKHVKAFRTIRQKSLSVTIHAGEAFGAESVNLALACSAQRIGHGTRVVEDERVLNEVIDRRIPLEICMSSNVQTKAVKTLDDHPVKAMFNKGVRTCICTDNPTVSGVTLSGEYLILQDKFDFTIPEIMKVIDYGFRAAFVPEGMIKRLRVEAFVKAMHVLQENNIDISGIIECSDYYARLGLTVPPKFVPPVQNPPLTLALLQELPKCDLDCRFLGSVPLPLLFKFYQELPDEEKSKLPKFTTLEDMNQFIFNEDESLMHTKSKNLALALLQTEENIRDGVRGILNDAYVDKVVYMEFTCCPIIHTKHLTADQFIECVLDEIHKFTEGKNMVVKVVLNSNISRLTPLQVQSVAELCVKYQGKGVVGFSTTSGEISVDDFRYYESTFNYLRENFVPITIFAGENNTDSVNCALVRGFARRISGGFKIPQSESLLNDVTSHHNAILIGASSRRMERAVTNWHKSPARFFFDFGVPIAFCSIHHTFYNMTRSQQLFELAQQSGFDALNIISIIDNSFASMNMHYQFANKYQAMFHDESIKILKQNGYTRFMNATFFKE
ncbi:putative adenosine deaminase [Tritrichomonas foetus]|uniref:adenosine deaminase n=1 Tax=Tritrichomonas foetus TaxID=1144522 RepID=A0A1J4KBD3_9EUKA|nr:putative adenosine deaminase [Tritrichomonas foetus]|eukprot:OHT08721.1 putative adenosine deaminase [Tritrichomonas foetus]